MIAERRPALTLWVSCRSTTAADAFRAMPNVRVYQQSFAAAIGLAEQVMSTLGMSTELIEGHISAMRRRLDSSRFREFIVMKSKRLNPFQVLRDQLAIMSFYERFEQVVALVLSAVIAVIIMVSLFQLISIVFTLLVLDAFNPLDHKVFQSVFGMIMTLLIAMEFKHSIVRVALRRDSIIQVKTVVLIAVIALSRKFVILDSDASPAKIAALAGATRLWVRPTGCCASTATAPPRPLSMTRHHPSDPRTALLQHLWLNRLQTGLLVLTPGRDRSRSRETAIWGRLPVARAVCRCRCVAAGTGSRVGAELAPVPRTGLAPATSPRDVGPVARAARHAGAALCAQCRRQRLRHRIEAEGIDRPHRWPAAQPEPTRAGGCVRARGRAHR